MPASQITSMNCRPPRAIEPSSDAAFPAAKARIRNRLSWNIGSAIFVSSTQKRASSTTPAARPPSTHGLVQPVG
jgi:hypothetical protein